MWLEEYVWGRDLLRQYVGATNTMTPTKCAIGKDSTSKLSPWLAHGCLSPRLVWQEIERYEKQVWKAALLDVAACQCTMPVELDRHLPNKATSC